jgi:hypothetical protein
VRFPNRQLAMNYYEEPHPGTCCKEKRKDGQVCSSVVFLLFFSNQQKWHLNGSKESLNFNDKHQKKYPLTPLSGLSCFLQSAKLIPKLC